MKKRETESEGGGMRVRAGNIGGFIGLGMGLMALLASASEGTGFAPGDGAFLVLGFMIAGYAAGWLVGPVISGLTENS